jgi:hypothetical protein
MKSIIIDGMKAGGVSGVLEALVTQRNTTADAAYSKSATIKRALSVRSETLASIEIGVFDKETGEQVKDTPASNVIDFVNPEWGQDDLIKYTENALGLFDVGAAWRKVRIGGVVRELQFINPMTKSFIVVFSKSQKLFELLVFFSKLLNPIFMNFNRVSKLLIRCY